MTRLAMIALVAGIVLAIVFPSVASPVHRAFSTGYCYGGTTASGRHTRFGYVATYPGKYRLGTYLRLVRPGSITDPVTGAKRHTLRVMDRGYTPMDVWFTPGPGVHEPGCHWGRKWVSYRLAGWRRP